MSVNCDDFTPVNPPPNNSVNLDNGCAAASECFAGPHERSAGRSSATVAGHLAGCKGEKKGIFRKSRLDADGYLAERRAAVVVTMPHDGAFFFTPVLARALRQFADMIDSEVAALDSMESHVLAVDGEIGCIPVAVDVLSLDGVSWKSGPDHSSDAVDKEEATRVLTPSELEAIL